MIFYNLRVSASCAVFGVPQWLSKTESNSWHACNSDWVKKVFDLEESNSRIFKHKLWFTYKIFCNGVEDKFNVTESCKFDLLWDQDVLQRS